MTAVQFKTAQSHDVGGWRNLEGLKEGRMEIREWVRESPMSPVLAVVSHGRLVIPEDDCSQRPYLPRSR